MAHAGGAPPLTLCTYSCALFSVVARSFLRGAHSTYSVYATSLAPPILYSIERRFSSAAACEYTTVGRRSHFILVCSALLILLSLSARLHALSCILLFCALLGAHLRSRTTTTLLLLEFVGITIDWTGQLQVCNWCWLYSHPYELGGTALGEKNTVRFESTVLYTVQYSISTQKGTRMKTAGIRIDAFAVRLRIQYSTVQYTYLRLHCTLYSTVSSVSLL